MNETVFEEMSDKDLIRIIVNAHGAIEAIKAKEELDYRKYLVQKRQNTVVSVIAIVSALTAITNIVLIVLGY